MTPKLPETAKTLPHYKTSAKQGFNFTMAGELTMTVAPRLALQRGYATRTFSMSSILASTASRALRMLVDAASAAAVANEGGRGGG